MNSSIHEKSPINEADLSEEHIPEDRNRDARRLASALIVSRPLLFIGLILLSSLAGIWTEVLELPSNLNLMEFLAIDRLLKSIATFVIISTLLFHAGGAGINTRIKRFFRYLLLSFFFWLLTVMPTLLISPAVSSGTENIFLLLIFVTIPLVISYEFFAYFFIASATNLNIYNIFKMSRSITLRDRILPLHAMLAPAAMQLLVTSALSLPYPDGRELTTSIFVAASGSLLWVLSSLYGATLVLCVLNDDEWRSLKLDPYRAGRIESISVFSSDFIAKLFSLKSASLILALGILVWVGNMARLASLEPAVELNLIGVEADGAILSLELEVKDERYLMRGFQPGAFMIAGEALLESEGGQRPILSTGAPEVSFDGKVDPKFLAALPRKESGNLILKFETSRSGDALTSLKDLWLWYRQVKIKKIDFEVPEG